MVQNAKTKIFIETLRLLQAGLCQLFISGRFLLCQSHERGLAGVSDMIQNRDVLVEKICVFVVSFYCLLFR